MHCNRLSLLWFTANEACKFSPLPDCDTSCQKGWEKKGKGELIMGSLSYCVTLFSYKILFSSCCQKNELQERTLPESIFAAWDIFPHFFNAALVFLFLVNCSRHHWDLGTQWPPAKNSEKYISEENKRTGTRKHIVSLSFLLFFAEFALLAPSVSSSFFPRPKMHRGRRHFHFRPDIH